jgi:hypothetical protein
VSRSNQIDVPNLRRSQISEFAQDDWRVTKRLTLNLGVRYDVFTPVTETSNHLALFDPTTLSMLVAGVNDVSRTGNVQTDWSNVAPRIGFEIAATPKTIVRGGFGMTYQPMGQITFVANNPPFLASYSPNPFTVALDTPFPAIVPSPITPSTALSGGLGGEDPHLKNEYIEQFALNVQREVGGTVFTAGYVGNLGFHLGNFSNNLDYIPLTDSPNYIAMEAYHSALPNVTSITITEAWPTSHYHAFQFVVERRPTHGLTVSGNYTFARNLGDDTAYSDNNLSQGTGIIPPLFHQLDYGNSDLDVRHRIALQINYALPFAKESHGVVGALAKGWQANAIDFWQTGTAFSVVDSLGQANPSDPTDRPNEIGNPNTGTCSNGSKVHTLNCWFNPDAFAQQQLGTIGVKPGGTPGTIGPWAERRNQLYGPHYRRFDLSVFKDWKLAERYTLQFRAESFNLTNTPNYAQPTNSVSGWNSNGTPSLAGGLSSLTSLRFGSYPRQIQFALKLNF